MNGETKSVLVWDTVQLILLGSGFATEDLSPTGTYDGPTNASLHKLWEVRYR
jgi:hypothetical protein